jgi:hypothetical protein
VAILEESVGKMPANKPRSARDENLHTEGLVGKRKKPSSSASPGHRNPGICEQLKTGD